jgi:hypothetical protein
MSTRLHKYICIYVRTAYQIAHIHKYIYISIYTSYLYDSLNTSIRLQCTNECHTVIHSIMLQITAPQSDQTDSAPTTTRVLRRRTDTGSQTRTSSRTTHYEIEPPAVSGHQPPPGRTQTSPGPGTILPGAPNPRRAFGHVHRPMGKGGGLGNYIGGAMDVPPWTQAPRIRVRLGLGRHCTRHPAWAVIQHHTPGYTPVPWTWHPNRDCPFRASNNRPETNPPIALPWPDTQCNYNGGGTGDDTQGTSTGHTRPIGPAYPTGYIYMH